MLYLYLLNSISRDTKHVEWIQSFFAILKSLQKYVKQHHPQGVTWNEKDGVDAKDVMASLPTDPVPGATDRKSVV